MIILILTPSSQAHRINAYAFGRLKLVGRLFSMFRLWSITKYAGAFTSAMETIIQNETIRVPSEPPQEETLMMETLKKTLADVDHEYLSRLARKSKIGRAPQQSKYRQAMLQYLALFNAPLTPTLTHYCWDPVRGRPCCTSRADMVDKMVAACSKLFLKRRPETPTQKEWTRIRLACCWCLMGMTRSRLLCRGVHDALRDMRAEASSSAGAPVPVAAHEAGAGENDLVQINASRLDSTCAFLADTSTGPMLCSIVLASRPTGALVYHLFGSFGKSVSAQEMLGVRESRVGKVAEELLTLLKSWADQRTWAMMECWSNNYELDDSMLRMARHQGFSQAAGVYWRFLLYYSDGIFPLHSLLDPGATRADKDEAVNRAFSMDFRCCLSGCMRQISMAVGSEDGLRSQLGLGVLRVLFGLIRFGISKVERLHSLHRHWCQHQGGGNRSIVHLSCRHQVHEQWVAFRERNPQRVSDLDALLVKESQVIKEVEQSLRPTAAPSGRVGIGGNPKFTMRNSRLAAAKMAKNGGKLTKDEVDEVTAQCLEEYEQMCLDPDEYQVLYESFRQEHAERQVRLLQSNEAEAGVGEFGSSGDEASMEPLWQHGKLPPHWPTDLSYLQEQLEACENLLHKSSGVREYYVEEPYYVVPASPNDASRPTRVDVRGCSQKQPFVCMDRNRLLRKDIEAAVRAFNEVVRRVGKERAESVSVLLHCHGRNRRDHSLTDLKLPRCLAARPQSFHIMMCLPFYQPQVQVYAVAERVDDDHHGVAPAPVFPYMVRACEGPSLVSRHFQSLVFTFTGQLAQYMARTFGTWDIKLLEERPASLMDWEVLGESGEPISLDFDRIAASASCLRSGVLREMASMPVRRRLRTKAQEHHPSSLVKILSSAHVMRYCETGGCFYIKSCLFIYDTYLT